jgi:alcohol dehydrogenase (NADP+)
MAVKFAPALGVYVVIFSKSLGKLADTKALGADEVILSTDEAQIANQASRFDFIPDTVSSRHPLNSYLRSLKLDGTLYCLGIPKGMDFRPILLTMGRRRLTSSGGAGTLETQEMLDFCRQHQIAADVEIIAAADIDNGFKRLERGEVRYRPVIDMSTLNVPCKTTAQS